MGCGSSAAAVTATASTKSLKSSSGGGVNAALDHAKSRRQTMEAEKISSVGKKDQIQQRRLSLPIPGSVPPPTAGVLADTQNSRNQQHPPLRRANSVDSMKPPRRLTQIQRSKASSNSEPRATSPIPNSEHMFTKPEKKRENHSNLNKLVRKREMVAL